MLIMYRLPLLCHVVYARDEENNNSMRMIVEYRAGAIDVAVFGAFIYAAVQQLVS